MGRRLVGNCGGCEVEHRTFKECERFAGGEEGEDRDDEYEWLGRMHDLRGVEGERGGIVLGSLGRTLGVLI